MDRDRRRVETSGRLQDRGGDTGFPERGRLGCRRETECFMGSGGLWWALLLRGLRRQELADGGNKRFDAGA
jgi:hypothetical protein